MQYYVRNSTSTIYVKKHTYYIVQIYTYAPFFPLLVLRDACTHDVVRAYVRTQNRGLRCTRKGRCFPDPGVQLELQPGSHCTIRLGTNGPHSSKNYTHPSYLTLMDTFHCTAPYANNSLYVFHKSESQNPAIS